MVSWHMAHGVRYRALIEEPADNRVESVQAQPECGKPLCNSLDHHPLCEMAAQPDHSADAGKMVTEAKSRQLGTCSSRCSQFGECDNSCGPEATEAQAGADDAVLATLSELRACFASWQPDVRVLGNVRAADAVHAIDAVLALPKPAEGGAVVAWQAVYPDGRLYGCPVPADPKPGRYFFTSNADQGHPVRPLVFGDVATAGSGEAVAYAIFDLLNPQAGAGHHSHVVSPETAKFYASKPDNFRVVPLYAGAPPAADAWKTIEEMCVITEAVTPDASDVRGTIDRLIDYHVCLAGGEGA